MRRPLCRLLLTILVAGPIVLAAAVLPAEEAGIQLETERDQVLYALGAMLGQQLRGFELSKGEFETLNQGLRDAALERALQVDPMAMQEQLNAFQQERMAAGLAEERGAADAFVREAAKQKGAVQTESGLVFQEVAAGSGAAPETTSVVKVHYHGTLRDGTVFDSTTATGTPATFPLDRVIQCWQEGLLRMKVGGKSRLVCPSKIAYGDRGFPPVIPAGAALEFEVELVDIVR